MYNQPEAILEQYDLEINQITKGRGAYICSTDQGIKLLMPFRGSRDRALFLKSVLEELNRHGYPAEQVCCTKEGEPLAEDDAGVRYWLKSMISGSECQTGRWNDMRHAAGQLAKLHGTIETLDIAVPEFMKNSRNDPQILYERHYRELIKVKNYVKTRGNKNDFERRFQEQYPHYIAEAAKSLKLLGELSLNCSLCHGDFNQHNVVRTQEGFRIINFENMCYNPSVSDLANFVRKMLEKNNWNQELGMNLIDEYGRHRRLSREDFRLLYVLLLFPEKFWKISNHYAGSHKAWVSERDIDKLERMIRQEEGRTLFLENLFSIV